MKIPTSQESGGGSFERPHIAEGLYKANLKEVKEDIKDGKYGKRVAFIFQINANNQNVELSHLTYVPEVANPNNKFGKALKALGVDLGQEVDTSSLKNIPCKVMVEDFTVLDQNGNETNQVASLVSKVKPLEEESGEQEKVPQEKPGQTKEQTI